MKTIFVCQACGKSEVVDDPIVTSIPCECGSSLLLSTSLSRRPKNVVEPVGRKQDRYAISDIVAVMQESAEVEGERTEICLTREQNIEGIIFDVLRRAVETNNSKVPIIYAVKRARRIDVTRETAEGYVKELVAKRFFDMDNYNFIVDPKKAGEILENGFKPKTKKL